jgi:hypothetical protein
MKSIKNTEVHHLEKAGSIRIFDADVAIDPVLEARLLRKLDIRLLPIVTLIYLFAFIDRSNAGNARVLGLPTLYLHFQVSSNLEL